MDKKKLEKLFKERVIERINESLGDYTEWDCFFEDNEMSDEEIEYIQSLQLKSVVLEKD
jgi:hypothetical protein